MIYDTIDRIAAYRGISSNLDTAIAHVLANDLSALEVGRYEVDGNAVYLMAQVPALKARDATKWEVHRQYIDIQIGLVPGEAIGYAPMSEIDGWQAYQPEKDIQISTVQTIGAVLPLSAGMFALFFPWDAHRPTERIGNAETGKKIVYKVRMEPV